MTKHEFDPGYTGLSTRCNKLVVKPGTTYADECGMPVGNPIHFQPDAGCVGCLTGHDIGLPSSEVAYAHPGCPVHGEPDPPLSPEQEEAIGALCWCGGEVGPREPGDDEGLGCLEHLSHDWHGRVQDGDKVDVMALTLKVIAGDRPVSALGIVEEFDAFRREREGTWPLAREECDHNPGVSCAEIMRRGNGHCCREYD